MKNKELSVGMQSIALLIVGVAAILGIYSGIAIGTFIAPFGFRIISFMGDNLMFVLDKLFR